MPEFGELVYFLGVSILLIIAPGPDIIYLITKSIQSGPNAGITTALGLASGNLVHTLAAALGVAAIFQTSTLAFEGLKIAGVCYLLFLAYETLRSNKSDNAPESVSRRQSSLYVRGVLMNVLNPKVALFFLAFLPQFVTSNGWPVWQQMIFFGVTFTVLVIIIFGLIGLFAGSIQIVYLKNFGNSIWIRATVAMVFVSLAARLFYI